jgi:hypothetical protein
MRPNAAKPCPRLPHALSRLRAEGRTWPALARQAVQGALASGRRAAGELEHLPSRRPDSSSAVRPRSARHYANPNTTVIGGADLRGHRGANRRSTRDDPPHLRADESLPRGMPIAIPGSIPSIPRRRPPHPHPISIITRRRSPPSAAHLHHPRADDPHLPGIRRSEDPHHPRPIAIIIREAAQNRPMRWPSSARVSSISRQRSNPSRDDDPHPPRDVASGGGDDPHPPVMSRSLIPRWRWRASERYGPRHRRVSMRRRALSGRRGRRGGRSG